MRTKKDIIDHVTQATGLAREEVGKVIEAAFAYVRENALAGTDIRHPSLGRIRVKRRDAEGAKAVYRYQPRTERAKPRKPAGGAPEAGPTP
jgi:nucleoid DNA-binding protein